MAALPAVEADFWASAFFECARGSSRWETFDALCLITCTTGRHDEIVASSSLAAHSSRRRRSSSPPSLRSPLPDPSSPTACTSLKVDDHCSPIDLDMQPACPAQVGELPPRPQSAASGRGIGRDFLRRRARSLSPCDDKIPGTVRSTDDAHVEGLEDNTPSRCTSRSPTPAGQNPERVVENRPRGGKRLCRTRRKKSGRGGITQQDRPHNKR